MSRSMVDWNVTAVHYMTNYLPVHVPCSSRITLNRATSDVSAVTCQRCLRWLRRREMEVQA